VILATLVLQGLSLPFLARLNEIAERDPAKADALQRLRVEYEDHIRQVEGSQSADAPLRLFSSEYERLSHEALLIERGTIIELRNQEVINDEVLRRIQQDIDGGSAAAATPANSGPLL
jgi:NhaP-type Na+/H+ or K+/H+ antiporter